MIRELLKKLVYPHKYSTEAYVKYIRSGGGQIGKNCRFYGPTSINIDSTSFPFISIGDNVVLTENVIILAHDYSYEVLENIKKPVSLRPQQFTKIGNNVFVGMRSIILMGAEIGDNVIVGAGSIVSGKIPSNCVCAGNPARVICTLEEHKEKLKKRFYDSSRNYALGFKIKNGRFPTEEEMVIYSTLIKGHENAYESINSAGLVNEDKYDSVEALMKSKE